MSETVSPVKMHGSWRCIKAFQGKLSIVEAVDLEVTSGFSNLPRPNIPAEAKPGTSQSFSTSGSSFPANLG
jgi:hypothetical protein